MLPENPTIAIVGLGYVGLPLAVEFGKHFQTIGFDLIHRQGCCLSTAFCDPTGEVSADNLRRGRKTRMYDRSAPSCQADFFVVAVPTPVDAAHSPILAR
jgi:UDP-N-acetyl-D-galactosamine dehydrogenase